MPTPRPYQYVGRDFLAARKVALLADEMRVGKTPQAILAAAKVGAQKMLVVCPAIAVEQWRSEIPRWFEVAGAAILPNFTVASYDRAKIDRNILLAKRWDVTVVDECHFAKNPEAERTKLVYGKGGLGWCSDRLWALSGTPAPKNAAELWPMLCAFGAVTTTYGEFVRRYCRVDDLGKIRGTKESMIPELRAILSGVMLRRTRREVAPDMPDIAFDFLNVKPAFEADLTTPATWTDKELAGYIDAYPTANGEERQSVALAKVPALAAEITESLQTGLYKQTVAFGWHVAPLALLHQRLSRSGIAAAVISGATPLKQRAVIQAEFRAGRIQVVIANIIAAGTAIDLSAASHGYFLELDWVPGNNRQAANRLVSMDRSTPVTFDVVTWPGSMDGRVQRILLQRTRELAKLY